MKLSRSDLKLGIIDKTVIFDPGILPERNIHFLNNNIECIISSRKKTDKDFNINGNLFLKVKYECVRCLNDNIIDHKLPFDLDILSFDKKIDNDCDKFDFIQLKEMTISGLIIMFQQNQHLQMIIRAQAMIEDTLYLLVT